MKIYLKKNGFGIMWLSSLAHNSLKPCKYFTYNGDYPVYILPEKFLKIKNILKDKEVYSDNEENTNQGLMIDILKPYFEFSEEELFYIKMKYDLEFLV